MEEIYQGTLKDQRTNAKLRASYQERCKHISNRLEEYDLLEGKPKAELTESQEYSLIVYMLNNIEHD